MKQNYLLRTIFFVCIVLGISISSVCVFADQEILDIASYQRSFIQWEHTQTLLTGTLSFSRGATLALLRQSMLLSCEKKIVDTNLDKDVAHFLVSPVCLIQGNMEGLLSTPVATNIVWPMVSSFSGVYNESSTLFSYPGAQVIWDGAKLPYRLSLLTALDVPHKLFLLDLQKSGVKLRLSSKDVAWIMAQKFSFFAVKKDLTPLKKCTKQNYTTALDHFDGYVFLSGSSLNVNDEISNLPGYCKGSGPQDLLFYGGVCGFATQFFRLSLLVPNIDILKREGHSYWLVPYYSDYVYGDDAALYQMRKQLELKNSLGMDIYIKVLKNANTSYLVAILPRVLDSYAQISKQELGTLQGQVVKTIYQRRTQNYVDSQIFSSAYTHKTYNVY